jgi:hypothetical protein
VVGRKSGRLQCQGSAVLTPLLAKLFFSIFILRIYFENLQKSKCTFSDKNKNKNFMQKKFKGFPCRICRDIPVKFAGISL